MKYFVKISVKSYSISVLVLSWADVPNWPVMNSVIIDEETSEDNDATSRSDNFHENLLDPEPANITWFRYKDFDNTGALSLSELLADHTYNNWYNFRYKTAIDRLISEADLNNDRVMDMQEYLK